MVNDINREMKAVYESASSQLSVCEAKLLAIRTEQNKIRDYIKSIASNVNSYCCSIQSICSKFSFRDECETLVLDLQMRGKLIEEFQDKQTVLTMLRSLQDLSISLEPTKEEIGIISDACVHITGNDDASA
jgi:hypothetical protein